MPLQRTSPADFDRKSAPLPPRPQITYMGHNLRVIPALTEQFLIERPTFDPATGKASFGYGLDGLHFTETLGLPTGADAAAAGSPSFRKLLDLTAIVLGVSYFKLRAPF